MEKQDSEKVEDVVELTDEQMAAVSGGKLPLNTTDSWAIVIE